MAVGSPFLERPIFIHVTMNQSNFDSAELRSHVSGIIHKYKFSDVGKCELYGRRREVVAWNYEHITGKNDRRYGEALDCESLKVKRLLTWSRPKSGDRDGEESLLWATPTGDILVCSKVTQRRIAATNRSSSASAAALAQNSLLRETTIYSHSGNQFKLLATLPEISKSPVFDESSRRVFLSANPNKYCFDARRRRIVGVISEPNSLGEYNVDCADGLYFTHSGARFGLWRWSGTTAKSHQVDARLILGLACGTDTIGILTNTGFEIRRKRDWGLLRQVAVPFCQVVAGERCFYLFDFEGTMLKKVSI